MTTILKTLCLIPTLLLAVQSHAQTPPEHTLTGNVGLVSDYRFRGISQTWRQPAIQGGLDYAHSSGAYAGVWASNVSGNSYNNGAGLELDLYGGYKFSLTQDLTLDLGVLAYLYPSARLNSAPGVATREKYDNLDVYIGLSAGTFSAKLSVAASDYFGLNGTTAGYAYFSGLPARGASKGSSYLDLNYRFDLGSGFNLDAHLGRLSVRHYGELSYTDLKLGLSKEVGGFNLGAALVATDAPRDYYQAGNSAGQDAKRLGRAALVLSAARTF
ncbi:TorF family putative porin [Paucibacter sp. XJ19-41]|uniref:TorF family putative porin n=1 Tax=Paucibacter sp. XJ19-41 TaxID=2927824 RepID=UPI00234909E0|nr:TorF family putative porin [Paucibacter sp. XJ19-41]MDC6166215.1 TorF family putative porin [Paucibacter sp. XJ19-41]